MFEPDYKEVCGRIRTLREDMDITMQEMAEATGRTVAEYAAQESGETDPSFTFLHLCARRVGVDVVELLTGEAPHLTCYSLTRANDGLQIHRRESFQYLHKAPFFKNRFAEPFLVETPMETEDDAKGPLHLSRHEGQEIDYILEGRMRFQYEDHEEILEAGDLIMYDSGRGHGMVALDGKPCKILAFVMSPEQSII